MLFRIKAGDREFYLVRASERPVIKKPSVDVAQVRALKARGGVGPASIAKTLGIGRASVYRALAT